MEARDDGAIGQVTHLLPLRTSHLRIAMKKLSGALVFLLLVAPAIFAQQAAKPAKPCAVAQQKQFDFWVGEWDLTWPGANGGASGHGTNSIKRILDGCVVEENFSGQSSMPLRGTSVSIFDMRAGKWKQTWVDNEGGRLAGEI